MDKDIHFNSIQNVPSSKNIYISNRTKLQYQRIFFFCDSEKPHLLENALCRFHRRHAHL